MANVGSHFSSKLLRRKKFSSFRKSTRATFRNIFQQMKRVELKADEGLKLNKQKRTYYPLRNKISHTPLFLTIARSPKTMPNIYSIYSKNKKIKSHFKQRIEESKYTKLTTAKPTRVTSKLKSIYATTKQVKKPSKRRKVRVENKNTSTHKLIYLEDNVKKEKGITKITTVPALVHLTIKTYTRDYPKTRLITKRKKDKGFKFGKSRKIPNWKSINNKKSKSKNREVKNKRYIIMNRDKTRIKNCKEDPFELLKKLKEESSVTDEEAILRANLNDALFHKNNASLLRRRTADQLELDANNKQDLTNTDEEILLKSKIYKAFGYEDDFAETVKQGLGDKT